MPTRSTSGRLRAALLGLLTASALLTTGAALAPSAFAALCQTCEDTPPPPPGPSHPPAPVVKHRLTIKNIVCYDKNDDVGNEVADEVYINVNGSRVWGKTSVGELNGFQNVNVSRDLTGGSGAYLGRIEMWDDDDTSADDKLASLDVYGTARRARSPGPTTSTCPTRTTP